MVYKRLEIYVGWTCNQKCTYCMEYPNMEKTWNKKVTKYEILKKLIIHKKLGYNHVTYLGGEPFIQGVFFDALKIGKKLGYTILVTTNATTIHIDSQAKKYLPYIDELILSVEAIDKELQQKISRTKNYVQWEGVFENIKKYWSGTFLKANIIITKDNIQDLFLLVEFLNDKGVKEIAISYPDIEYIHYGEEHIRNFVATKYSECMIELLPIINYCIDYGIRLKIPDIPFCIFPKDNIENYIKLTDDYDYQTRIKIDHYNKIIDRGDLSNSNNLPRARRHCIKCIKCKYKNICWGPSIFYEKLFGFEEINSIV